MAEITTPKPNKWYYAALDWPVDEATVWAATYPLFSTPFKATWDLASTTYTHDGLDYAFLFSMITRWRIRVEP